MSSGVRASRALPSGLSVRPWHAWPHAPVRSAGPFCGRCHGLVNPKRHSQISQSSHPQRQSTARSTDQSHSHVVHVALVASCAAKSRRRHASHENIPPHRQMPDQRASVTLPHPLHATACYCTSHERNVSLHAPTSAALLGQFVARIACEPAPGVLASRESTRHGCAKAAVAVRPSSYCQPVPSYETSTVAAAVVASLFSTPAPALLLLEPPSAGW